MSEETPSKAEEQKVSSESEQTDATAAKAEAAAEKAETTDAKPEASEAKAEAVEAKAEPAEAKAGAVGEAAGSEEDDEPAGLKHLMGGHSYDGIKEFDHPMPAWLHAVFIGTIIFGVVYFYYYEFGSGKSVAQLYEEELAANAATQFSDLGDLAGDAETILKYMDEDRWVAFGKSVFAGNCVSCHGKNGEGLVGPNLTDDHWKAVKSAGDIFTIVESGAAGGAMPAWGKRLNQNEMVLVSSYVASLRGKNLPSPRKQEGEVIPPWTGPAEADK